MGVAANDSLEKAGITPDVQEASVLERKGSGTVTLASKGVCEKQAPLYVIGWEALLKGRGKYALILGAGPATREVYYAFCDRDLGTYDPPEIHCYDISEPPQEFLNIQKEYPSVEMRYFGNFDLADFVAKQEYRDDTRLVSIHGVLDYMSAEAATNLLEQVVLIGPEVISLRLCLTTGPWETTFADANQEQRSIEQKSLQRLRAGQISNSTIRDLRNSIMQLEIPTQAKLDRNLSPDYPATYFQPDIVAGYLISQGYELLGFNIYDLSGRDEPSSILMVFTRRDCSEKDKFSEALESDTDIDIYPAQPSI